MSRLRFVSIMVLATALALGSAWLTRGRHSRALPTSPLGVAGIGTAALRQDVRLLRRALEAVHPGLYWYTPKPVLDSLFDQTERSLTKPLSERDFFVRLLPAVAAVRCIHTKLSPSNKPLGFGAVRYRYLPLALSVQQGRVFIINCYAPHRAAVLGAELLALNGQPTAQILARLMPLLPADGFNITAKYYALSRGAFEEGYSLLYPLSDSVVLRLQPLAGRSFRLKLPTLSLSERNTHRSPARGSQQDFDFALDSQGRVGVLTIRTFEPRGGAGAFRQFLRAVFQQLQQRRAASLVVDVRGNPGGNNALVTDLFAYVAARPFLHIRRAEMKASALAYFSPPQRPVGLDSLRTSANASGCYDMRFRYPGAVLRQPVSRWGFRGRVLVLIDGGTASAASELAGLARTQGRATLLGEEAGGGYAGATGGTYVHVTLPASGLQVRIPAIRIWLAVGNAPTGHGALPDIGRAASPAELLRGVDAPLNQALVLARTAAAAR